VSQRPSYLLGLVGAGIGASLTPAMQEREGDAAGLRITYRLIDAAKRGFGVADLLEVLWVSTDSTSPTRSSRP